PRSPSISRSLHRDSCATRSRRVLCPFRLPGSRLAGFCRPPLRRPMPVLHTFGNRGAAGAARDTQRRGTTMTGTVTHDPPPAAGGSRPSGPLIVTENAQLLDDLLRLCAAAGATPEVHHGLPEPRGSWEAAPLVLVGDDAARRVRGAARRRGVVLVGRDQDDSRVWRRALEIGADHVLMLPDGEQWL